MAATETGGRRRPPEGLFKIINPVVGALLRSPLHELLSGRLMLLSYSGRKSGRTYTTPIGYFVWGDDELISFSSSGWWTNFSGGGQARLLLRGRWRDAEAAVVESVAEKTALLTEFIRRFGLKTARQLPLGLPAGREPSAEDIQHVAAETVIVRFTLGD